jgi:hypothetical protein
MKFLYYWEAEVRSAREEQERSELAKNSMAEPFYL